jgi:hypothetical protein
MPATNAAWQAIAFENSTQREVNSRAAATWRQKRAIHVDLLVGNYLSHYFQELAEAIRNGASRFTRPRRTEGMRFYERCLPAGITLRPWPSSLPRVQPQGRWDWFVFDNATALFWDSMRPLVRHVLDGSFARCGLRATVRAPVLHFRCASAPLNRHSQYHFQRYSYFRAVARRYRKRHREPLRHVHVLTCVADDVQKAEQSQLCTRYLDDLVTFLRTELSLEVRVHNCAHSMFEDLAIMYYAPYLISTGSTMSLLPGLARAEARALPKALASGGLRDFVSPLLFDEESIALNSRAPGRRVGCEGCGWMLQRDHSLCQCEVPAYAEVPKVLALLRQPATPKSSVAVLPPAMRLCPHCEAARCERYRPIACEIAAPSKWRAADQPAVVEEAAASAANAAPPVSAAEAVAPHMRQRASPASLGAAASCAAAGAVLMSQSQCRSAARADYGRKWIGSSRNDNEAPGCVLWEDGNVEFNKASASANKGRCNVRGTCLCAGATGEEVQVVGYAAA